MRLIYAIRNYELTNGNGRLVWELSRRAQAGGHDVHVVAHRFPKIPALVVKRGLNWHWAPQLPKIFGTWRARSFAWAASRSAARLKGESGLVHGFGDTYRQDILTLGNTDWTYAERIPKRRASASAIWIKGRALRERQTKIITVVSNLMRSAITGHFPNLEGSKIRVIYPGVDLDRFNPRKRDSLRRDLSKNYGIDPQAFWIVFAAGGDFQKRNFDGVVGALERTKARGWNFLVAGAKASDGGLPRNLQGKTFFMGRVDDLGEVFPACDLMLYPAWYDEFALVCLEAWASGVAVILSRNVGASEILPKNFHERCLIENSGDSAQLALRIASVIEEWHHMPRQSFRKIAEPYTWERFWGQYAQLYDEVASQRDPVKSAAVF